MRLVVGLRPVSDTLDKPELARWAEPGRAGLSCAWRVAGWARPVSYTLGWQVAGWAGPEASRRHVRHASKGLGLLDDLGPDVNSTLAWPAWAELLGQPD